MSAARASVVRLPNGRYKVAVPVAKGEGRRTTRTFDSESEAKLWQAIAWAAIERGLTIPEPGALSPAEGSTNVATGPTVGELGDEWYPKWRRAAMRNRKTVKWANLVKGHLRNWVCPNLGHLKFEQITEDIAEDYVDTLSIGLPGSAKDALWTTKQLCAFAVRRGLIAVNPFEGLTIARPKTTSDDNVRVVSLGEASAIAQLLLRSHAAAFWIMRLTGLRISEAFGLLLEDVDLERRMLLVRRQGGMSFPVWAPEATDEADTVVVDHLDSVKSPAGWRVVPIPHLLWHLLDDYLDSRPEDAPSGPDAPFLVSNDGGEALQRAFRNDFDTALAALGMPSGEDTDNKLVPRYLRNSFITDLYDAEIEGPVLEMIAGHEEISDRVLAAVSRRHYISRTALHRSPRYLGRLAQAAAAVDALWEQQLQDDGLAPIVLPSAMDPGQMVLGFTYEEAAELLGVGRTRITTLVSSGALQAARGRVTPTSREVLIVTPESLRRFAEQRAARGLTIPEAADALDLQPSTINHWVRRSMDLLLPTASHRIGKEWLAYWQPEVDRLHMLAERSVPVRTAAEALGTSTRSVHGLLHLGQLTQDSELGLNGKIYVTKESVRREQQRRAVPRIDRALRASAVSTDEAAAELGVTPREVAALLAAGSLRQTANSRITRQSIDEHQRQADTADTADTA